MRPFLLLAFTMAVAAVAAPANAQLPTRKFLPTDIAVDAARAAVDACRQQDEHVAAAVADASGDALAIVRDDRSRGQSVEMARNWARQGAVQIPQANVQSPRSSSRGGSSEEAMRRAEDAQRRNEAQRLRQFGRPILVDGVLVGVIAVAGAQDPQVDLACATAGIEKVRDRLR